MNINQSIKKITVLSLIFGVLIGQFVYTPVVRASSVSSPGGGGLGGIGGGGSSESSNSSGSSDSLTNSANKVAQSAAQCLVSNLIASILTSTISSILGSAIGQSFSGTGIKVPIENQNNDLREHGMTVGGTSIPIMPSMNAIAYCLVNIIISYIADSTINWIRSGFDGNPVFVDDPEQFFQNLADYELGQMLNQITNQNVCQPFQLQVKLDLLRQSTRTYSNSSICNLGNSYQNLQSGFNANDWLFLTQNPNNNPYGSYIEIGNTLQARIEQRQNIQQIELGWSKGFLSFPDPEDPTGRKRLSPGALIEAQLAKRLGAPEDRLVLAEKFDQVINELVNSFVKIALNEMFEAGEAGNVNIGAYVQYFGGSDGSGSNPTRPLYPEVELPPAQTQSTPPPQNNQNNPPQNQNTPPPQTNNTNDQGDLPDGDGGDTGADLFPPDS